MPHVVTENCINCKYTDCATVCPTESFREGANMVVIDPDACIDCFACAAACPTGAIFADAEVPAQWQEYIALNARLSKAWPVITEKRECLGHPADGTSRRDLLDERAA